MRDRTVRILFSALLCLAARGQEPEAVFKSDSRLVEVHTTVTDKENKLLTNLQQDVFKIYENGVPQEIKVFRREDAPISLGLIIDNSASMRDKRAKVAAAVLTLVRASNPDDEEFIIGFDEKPMLVQEFTKQPAELEKAFARMEPRGATAMRDALAMGVEHLKRLGKSDKKVLLVVTDGEDNSSAETLARLTREANQQGVLIYAIGLLNDASPRESSRAKKDLDTLTFETGGEVFYPKELSEIDGIAQHVAHDLRNQYTIAYIPSDEKLDGTFRSIKVTVSAPADAVVRTRAGYYAVATPQS
jgi:Ca-activated chloride channel family protein